MQRRVFAALLISFATVLVVRADEYLKCYMCASWKDENCKTDPKAHHLQPIECNMENIQKFVYGMRVDNSQQPEAMIFDRISHAVDAHISENTPKEVFACMKTDFKVNGKDMTVRSCQSAQGKSLDPCKAIKDKLIGRELHNNRDEHHNPNELSVEYCGLCKHDACNGSAVTDPRGIFIFLAAIASIAAGFFRGSA